MTNPNYLQTNHFAPPGMIPAFNELGNHPTNMSEYVSSQLRETLGRLGLEGRYTEANHVLLAGVDALIDAPTDFSGRHIVSDATRPIQNFMKETFVRAERCTFTGKANYETALGLLDDGHNVVLVPNHTSPLDGLIPLTLFRDTFGDVRPPSLVMSQVFEYARITRLLTSCVNKYPVFQPKHIRSFVEGGQVAAAGDMRRQNIRTMRALQADADQGGQNVFLYLERDRNREGMGIPEPGAAGVLDVMERAKPGLHVLPMHISGAESIFPSRKGVNEIDKFMQTIMIGQGDVVCGRPIPFSHICEVAQAVDQRELIRSVFGSDEQVGNDPKQKRLATIAITILSLVADLAPTREAKGVYNNPDFLEGHL